MKFFGMDFPYPFEKQDLFTDDLRMSAYTENPTIIPDIDLVYVLSGRSTVLGADADGLKRACDPLDDLERLREGIRIATIINSLRANKRVDELHVEDYLIPIFYNGRTIHNKDLEEALQCDLLPYYPKELFIIDPIKPENTIGQIQSFANYLSSHHHKNVAIVSSAYHLPRVARMIALDSPQVTNENSLDDLMTNPLAKSSDSPLSALKLFLYGIHKHEKRPGIQYDLIGEQDAMQRYSSGPTPSIAKYRSKNVFFTDEDRCIYTSFAASLFWGNRAIVSEHSKSKAELQLVPYVYKQ